MLRKILELFRGFQGVFERLLYLGERGENCSVISSAQFSPAYHNNRGDFEKMVHCNLLCGFFVSGMFHFYLCSFVELCLEFVQWEMLCFVARSCKVFEDAKPFRCCSKMVSRIVCSFSCIYSFVWFDRQPTEKPIKKIFAIAKIPQMIPRMCSIDF